MSGPDAAVLLHAEAAERRDGEPQGAEGVPDLREDLVRPVNMEQTHADTHWSVWEDTKVTKGGIPPRA